jgi:hypothetical protein
MEKFGHEEIGQFLKRLFTRMAEMTDNIVCDFILSTSPFFAVTVQGSPCLSFCADQVE